MQQQLKQDWARTQGDIRLNSGVPLSWLKGCNPVMSQDQFAANWRAEGVLYRVMEGQGAHLCISLGTGKVLFFWSDTVTRSESSNVGVTPQRADKRMV